MPRETIYDEIQGLSMRLTFNEEKHTEEGMKYQPLTVMAFADAVTDDNGRRRVSAKEEIGDLQDAPLTLKQIYNNVPAALQNILKTLILDALNEDVSNK